MWHTAGPAGLPVCRRRRIWRETRRVLVRAPRSRKRCSTRARRCWSCANGSCSAAMARPRRRGSLRDGFPCPRRQGAGVRDGFPCPRAKVREFAMDLPASPRCGSARWIPLPASVREFLPAFTPMDSPALVRCPSITRQVHRPRGHRCHTRRRIATTRQPLVVVLGVAFGP